LNLVPFDMNTRPPEFYYNHSYLDHDH